MPTSVSGSLSRCRPRTQPKTPPPPRRSRREHLSVHSDGGRASAPSRSSRRPRRKPRPVVVEDQAVPEPDPGARLVEAAAVAGTGSRRCPPSERRPHRRRTRSAPSRDLLGQNRRRHVDEPARPHTSAGASSDHSPSLTQIKIKCTTAPPHHRTTAPPHHRTYAITWS
ncbi:hypothetical protein Ae717Ps2_6903c [Pseudonocardia sp. Ae717_Ps2]|nr:hypothetical protein Ae717Ps2_6903c [Pseudonocardia sp. Ae717_Ps2]